MERHIQIEPKHSLHTDILYEGAGKETIVLLNGSIFNFHQWDRIIHHGYEPAFGDRYQVVRYDYGRIGSSTSPTNRWDIFDLAKEFIQLLDTLGIEKAHCYGISKGTIVMQVVAILAPHRIASLAGYGWYYMGYSKIGDISKMLTRRTRDFYKLEKWWDQPVDQELFSLLWDRVYRRIIFQTSRPKNKLKRLVTDYLVKRSLYPLTQTTTIRAMYEWFDYALTVIPTMNGWYASQAEVLERFPILVQHAEQDFTLPIDMAEEFVGRFPQATFNRYGEYFTHVSPAFNRKQAARIMRDYHSFLAGIA